METTRRDWTALAKRFQTDLFTVLFQKEDSSDLQDVLGDLGNHEFYRQEFLAECDPEVKRNDVQVLFCTTPASAGR